MRWSRRQTSAVTQQGHITARELAWQGLGRYPSAIGIFWPEDQRVVCREHASKPVYRRVMERLRSPTAEATLLIGGPSAARALRRQCYRCPS